MFCGMGNHLGPLSGASDQSEGQEQGGGAIGGQGQIQIVTLVEHTRDLILGLRPMFWGMGNHLGPFV